VTPTISTVLIGLCSAFIPSTAFAASLDGAALGPVWAVPFAGMLLSIALGPLTAPHFWHAHYGKIAAFWGVLAAGALAAWAGPGGATEAVVHVFLLEYLPFILLLLALYTTAGGIVVSGNLHGSPGMNTGLLATGAVMASFVGTTGASMILIRPLLRANDDRKNRVHTVVFFIFIVSNIGGGLTPLGDPPLFLGFLRGVDFFWTTVHLWQETLFTLVVLLGLFFLIDSWLYAKEGRLPKDPTPDAPIRLEGMIQLPLVACIVGAILLSGGWKPGSIHVLGTDWPIQNIVREGVMIAVTILSLAVARREHREANAFDWEPIREVAKLFAGIFVCIIPVMAILQAGQAGAFAPLVSLVRGPDGAPNPEAFFWLTGTLSAVLDNAPTYLVFFELAGGDPARLMTEGAAVLAAISMGAVFLGAMTYVGNAPNFMVYAIARGAGVPMPSFFGFLRWSIGILGPVLLLMSLIFIE
jgi:Na+/H+ antiporter NhaD/arsenite permease-like protein